MDTEDLAVGEELDVWQVRAPEDELLVGEETCSSMEEVRLRGAELVSAIRAGTFGAPQSPQGGV